VCAAYLKIEAGKFVPTIGEPGKPFVCFDKDDPNFDAPTIRG
jgi:hypothetical protein